GSAPIVVANEEHRFLAAEQLRLVGVERADIVLEPVGRNTAPAIAAAALQAMAGGEDPLLLVLPSDHVVRDEAGFRDAVLAAMPAAEAGALVTFGIVPSAPETGFGYIQAGPGEGVRPVLRFVEKPGAATAPGYLRARGPGGGSGGRRIGPPGRAIAGPAAVSGAAACSCAAPRATSTNSRASARTCSRRRGRPSMPPPATAISSASIVKPSPRVRRT